MNPLTTVSPDPKLRKSTAAGPRSEKEAIEEEAAPVTRRDLRPIVRKLEVLLGEALAQAEKSGVTLPVNSLVLVVDEAVREATDLSYRAKFPETVEGVFLSGIYDELVQQPSNIFDVVTRSNGKSYYVPLSSGVWIRCLQELRQELLLSKSVS